MSWIPNPGDLVVIDGSVTKVPGYRSKIIGIYVYDNFQGTQGAKTVVKSGSLALVVAKNLHGVYIITADGSTGWTNSYKNLHHLYR